MTSGHNFDPLLIATTNPGKLREITQMLAGVPLRLITLPQVAGIAEPEETGHTFAENARLKARYYAEATGLTTVAEDSGLEVDALGGAPGVLSARFPGATFEDKFALLYRMLDEEEAPDSPARFVCALAVVSGAEVVFEARGVVEGRITRPPRGTNGFGYDPIFFYPPYEQTLAEVPDEKKAAVSHRGQAFGKLRDFLIVG